MRYFNGLKKNPKLTRLIGLKYDKDIIQGTYRYDLQILNASIQNEGIYKCCGLGNGVKTYETYQLIFKGMKILITNFLSKSILSPWKPSLHSSSQFD